MIRYVPGLLVMSIAVTGTPCQDPQSNPEVQDLQAQIREIRQQTDEAIERLETRLAEASYQQPSADGGTTGFLISGYSSASFTDVEGEDSAFGANLNPLFLWRISDRLLFEGELELELDDRETEVGLEYAQLTYLVNDHLTVGAGKFLVPFGQFGERLHPSWINKLPDAPIFWGHHGGLAPLTEVGVQARGAAPLGSARINYAVYLSNGPELLTSGHHAGELRFGSAGDVNNNKAVGGRVGLLPVPELEAGFSVMSGRAGPSGDPTSDVDALLWAADLAWVRSWDEVLKGTTDVRFEYMRSDVDAHPTLVSGQENERDGWYVQAAYRPDKVDSFLEDFEAVVRYDDVDAPGSLGADRSRTTFGLNYWIGPSAVAKVAYQLDDQEGRDEDAFFLQFAMGF